MKKLDVDKMIDSINVPENCSHPDAYRLGVMSERFRGLAMAVLMMKDNPCTGAARALAELMEEKYDEFITTD